MKEMELKTNLGTEIDFNGLAEKEIELTGMIQNLRVLAWGAFLILRTPRYTIQTVIDANNINIPPSELKVESVVKIRGIVKTAKIKDKAISPADHEIHVSHIDVISAPTLEAMPVDTTKKEMNLGLDTKFDLRPLTLRHTRERAIFRIAATICMEFGNYLDSIGFTRINSPKIVFAGAEGGANVFKLEYFERNAFLAQSPQFYKQMMVGVFGRVFEIGPVFRAEEHDTSRHLNEYISLDFEMGFIDSFYDLIQVEANLLRAIIARIAKDCAAEVALLGITLPKLEKVVTVKFSEVHEIIFNEYKKDYRNEKDLAPEEEKLISEYALKNWDTEFLFVTHYPTVKRPFYAMEDPENPEETLSFDLLFRGMEITTGGQRLHLLDTYLTKMKKLGMDPEAFESYLQAFRYGMPPHGGLGLGLERLTAMFCGLANIKEASLFPRDQKRLTP
ncbi:MAG: aspartate--tRNA(Asn) ligase [Spirochaetales bacterium]|nr:aspartate--tRNA(Asn) ligase [Spirochaetales bacterium]